MRSISLAILAILGFVIRVFAAVSSQTSGTFVRFDDLDQCPPLIRRARPISAKDVRPDDITAIAALGDSISAALVAKSSPDEEDDLFDIYRTHQEGYSQKSLLPSTRLGLWQEYRGLSYPTGLDPGIISIASVLSHYTNLTGGSTGSHLPATCPASACGLRGRDGLNAAVSGSMARGLRAQVDQWLVPRMKELGVKDEEWKFVNIGIGGNDICSYCLTPDIDIPLEHSPKQFASSIKDAVNHLRSHTSNLIVNIVGLHHISTLYDLKLRSNCTLPTLPLLPRVPSMAFECSCALLPTIAGDIARQKMDALADAYNEAILGLIREWEEEGDEGLGVMFQPGEAIDLDLWPGESLSKLDCFHPSAEAHQRVGAGFWNRLTMDLEDKARPIQWDDEVLIRCLEEGDRFPVGKLFSPAT